MSDELYRVVARHLSTQRESAPALELWDKFWTAYQQSRGEGVVDVIDQLIAVPGVGKEDQS